MEEFITKALIGIIGSSPVAGVLIWRLWVADKRAIANEKRIATLTDKWIGFLTKMDGGESEA